MKVIVTDENMYGEQADTNIDKAFAMIGFAGVLNPGSILKNKKVVTATTGKIIDISIDTAGDVHNSGALDSLKE